MISLALNLILTSLLYSGLIFTFIKLQSHGPDTKGPGTKVLAFFSYGVILANRGLLGGVWFLDLTLLLAASLFYFRVVADTSEKLPTGTIVTILISCLLVGGIYLHPAMDVRSVGGGASASERSCASNMKVINGSLEMYLLDKGIDGKKKDAETGGALQKVEKEWQSLFLDGQYLQSVPRCQDRDYELVANETGLTVKCPEHGEILALLQAIRMKRPVMPRDDRRVIQACFANLKTLSGSVEMYVLDYDVGSSSQYSTEKPGAREALLKPGFEVLVNDGYLQMAPDCAAVPGNAPNPYTITLGENGSGGRSGFHVACQIHGDLAAVGKLLGVKEGLSGQE